MPMAILLVLFAAVYRVLPHPWNVAPIGALALLGGLYFPRRLALILPLAALMLTDGWLNVRHGSAFWHTSRLFDYAGFMLIGGMGLWLRHRSTGSKVGGAAATPFLFFVVSNFGVWLAGIGLNGLPYEKSAAGLLACYGAGLPFLRGTVIGDWGFLLLFVAAAALVRASAPAGARWLIAPARA
jgi:hypothetical protein